MTAGSERRAWRKQLSWLHDPDAEPSDLLDDEMLATADSKGTAEKVENTLLGSAVGVTDEMLATADSKGTAEKVENTLFGRAVGVTDEAAEMLATIESNGTAEKVENRLLGTAVGVDVGSETA